MFSESVDSGRCNAGMANAGGLTMNKCGGDCQYREDMVIDL